MSEPSQSIRNCALDVLARREHSRAELRRKLVARGFSTEDIGAELERLEADRLLDDRRFAELYIRHRVGRGFGPGRIRAELRERGVEVGLIEECLDSAEVDWDDELVRAWQKKFGKPGADYREQSKQARFLEYRGYSAGSISKFLYRPEE